MKRSQFNGPRAPKAVVQNIIPTFVFAVDDYQGVVFSTHGASLQPTTKLRHSRGNCATTEPGSSESPGQLKAKSAAAVAWSVLLGARLSSMCLRCPEPTPSGVNERNKDDDGANSNNAESYCENVRLRRQRQRDVASRPQLRERNEPCCPRNG